MEWREERNRERVEGGGEDREGRRDKSRGGNWETHREVRQAKKEKQVFVAQLNHNTFMFIGNSWLQSLKKGVVSQTCQIGEAAGLLECVKVRRPANLLIWLQENNLPREGKQMHKSSVLGRVHPRALTKATPPPVCPCVRGRRGDAKVHGWRYSLASEESCCKPWRLPHKALDRVAMMLCIWGSGSFLQRRKGGKGLKQVRQSKLAAKSWSQPRQALQLTWHSLSGSTFSVFSPTFFLVIEALYAHHRKKHTKAGGGNEDLQNPPTRWQDSWLLSDWEQGSNPDLGSHYVNDMGWVTSAFCTSSAWQE